VIVTRSEGTQFAAVEWPILRKDNGRRSLYGILRSPMGDEGVLGNQNTSIWLRLFYNDKV